MTEITNVAIASESPYTVDAGRQLAEMGGNAVDIAWECRVQRCDPLHNATLRWW